MLVSGEWLFRGTTNHETRRYPPVNRGDRTAVLSRFQCFEQYLDSHRTLLFHILMNRSQRWVAVRRGRHVVEADYRAVPWNLPAGLMQRPNRSDSGQVVVRDYCRKLLSPSNQLSSHLIAAFVADVPDIQFSDQVLAQAESGFPCE